MLSALKNVVWMVVVTTVLAWVLFLFDYAFTIDPRPVGYNVLFGAVFAFGTFATEFATRKGWIRGVFRDPKQMQERGDRAARLAQERARIIARATHQ